MAPLYGQTHPTQTHHTGPRMYSMRYLQHLAQWNSSASSFDRCATPHSQRVGLLCCVIGWGRVECAYDVITMGWGRVDEIRWSEGGGRGGRGGRVGWGWGEVGVDGVGWSALRSIQTPSPHITTHHHASSRTTSPQITSHRITTPHQTTPHQTTPHQTTTRHTESDHTTQHHTTPN